MVWPQRSEQLSSVFGALLRLSGLNAFDNSVHDGAFCTTFPLTLYAFSASKGPGQGQQLQFVSSPRFSVAHICYDCSREWAGCFP